jgi:hypothetical protein
MSAIRRHYGATPVHVLLHVALFALAGWVVLNLLDAGGALNILVWFVGAIVLHDMVVLPLYTTLDRLVARLAPSGGGRTAAWPVSAINHVRVPAVLAGVLLLVWFPLILGLSEDNIVGLTGVGPPAYLERWLGICAVLFGGSALLYVVRLVAAGRSAAGSRRADRSRARDR